MNWTRKQLLVAFGLYTQMSFGQFHAKNRVIIKTATALGRTPSALAMKLCNIASVDPTFRATGKKGLRSASTADRNMWEEMTEDWTRFTLKVSRAATSFALATRIEELTTEENVSSLSTERAVESIARIGQGFFRRALRAAYNDRCCVSGLSFPSLLIASHIVPWGHDPVHRLNPRNGLLLSALHDRAFDGGLMTLDEDCRVVISSRLLETGDPYMQTALGAFHGKPIETPEKFAPAPEFMAYHREHIFHG